jgi:hypothetical protein
VVYDGQRDTITDLQRERNQVRLENANVTSQLAKSRSATKTASAKLAVVSKNLRRARAEGATARKTASAARADSAAAKRAAAAQYGEEFSAGTQSGYSAGASDTYDSGLRRCIRILLERHGLLDASPCTNGPVDLGPGGEPNA